VLAFFVNSYYRKGQQEIREIITEYVERLKANPENENIIIEVM